MRSTTRESSDDEPPETDNEPNPDEDPNGDLDDEEPLFTGNDQFDDGCNSDVTVQFRSDVKIAEIIGGLLVLKTRHKMTWSLFLAIIAFLQALFVTDNTVFPKTHQQLKKFFDKIHGVQTCRVAFCKVCERICKILPNMLDRPDVLFCARCDHDVAKDIKERRGGSFIYTPFLPQLRSYVEKSPLFQIVEKFRDEALAIFRGERFRGVLERGNIPIIIGSDAAPITKNSEKVVYPVVISLENIPHCLKRHFAILSACFAGRKENEPPTHLMYKMIKRELKRFQVKAFRYVYVLKSLRFSEPLFSSLIPSSKFRQ
jgi:hypothetical protein